MNKNSIILLSVGLVVLLGLGIFFITNMPGRDDTPQDMPAVNDPTGPGEPTQTPPTQPAAGEQTTGGPRVDEDEDEDPDDPHAGHNHEFAADFTLKNLEGEEVSLSDYRGKYVFLNFWATWCVYCDLEMPDFQEFYEANEDLVILAVNYKEDLKTVKDYIEDGGYTFPVVLDTDGAINEMYYVTAYPTTFFIDKEGILLAYYPGMLTPELMEEGLKILKEH